MPKKPILIIAAVLILGGLAFGIWLISGKLPNQAKKSEQAAGTPPPKMVDLQGEEAAKNTQDLIAAAKKREGLDSQPDTATPENVANPAKETGSEETAPQTENGEGAEAMEPGPAGEAEPESNPAPETVEIIRSTSPVSVETGQVVTDEGEPVENDATPSTPSAPQQSLPLTQADITDGSYTAILEMTTSSITPNRFEVKAGQLVSLVAVSKDRTHIFRFEDPSLKAVALGLGPGEMRSITFNAPTKPGEYVFYSDVANFRAQGAEGVMVVK